MHSSPALVMPGRVRAARSLSCAAGPPPLHCLSRARPQISGRRWARVCGFRFQSVGFPWNREPVASPQGLIIVDISVELTGLEPVTPCLQSRCATNCAIAPRQPEGTMSIVAVPQNCDRTTPKSGVATIAKIAIHAIILWRRFRRSCSTTSPSLTSPILPSLPVPLNATPLTLIEQEVVAALASLDLGTPEL